ncbi:hypothetical protein K432DRAFT_216315 [Lepidopterella palustris CBS 459.81]|uniref:Heterokaryon incompatibility domain-containing protein n=1 Tax=Lepidopterella palustris CBS 459.81 TaxID=1314670 RepID=A0A8E2EL33_9PEZI|nr:hypothetical protein K432DRAFT_216315 [Lepidopterella palustris CBS 459.81]
MRVGTFFNLRLRFSQKANIRPQTYQYEPLSSAKSIRLLEISPSAGSKVICCSLKTFELRNAPAFDALSYTWGHPLTPLSRRSALRSKIRGPPSKGPIVFSLHDAVDIPSQPIKLDSSGRIRRYPILIDGRTINVTENLRDALRMLSGLQERIEKPRHVWIDALCVDQENIAERNAQVALMADTFKAAQRVIVWLGKEDEFTADALSVIEQVSAIPEELWSSVAYTSFYEDDECYKKLQIQHLSSFNWLGFIALLNRSWFKRAWVVQEIALARSAVLVCGSRVFPWDKLSKTLAFIKSTKWYHHLTTEKMKHLAALKNHTGVYKKFLSSKADISMAAMYLDRTRLDMAVSGRLIPQAQLRRRKPSLRLLLETHRYSKSTDARDKVYAFLGLADRRLPPFNHQPKVLTPDYKQSVQNLYLEVARALLISHEDLGLLSHVQDMSHTRIPNLPSWVPDYSVVLHPYPLKFRGPCQWNASGDSRWKPDTSAMEKGQLHVQGFRLDIIDKTSILRNESKDPLTPWASTVGLAFGLDDYYQRIHPKDKPVSRVEVLWRTLTTNTYARQHPAPSLVGKLFIDYILNLQIRHRLMPWSSEVEFQPHHAPLSKSTYPEWHALLASEPPLSPYGLESYKQRLSAVVESLFAGTYSPIGLAQLQHEFDISGGRMRRLFKTRNKYLGTGARSLQIDDEVWVLAGAPVPFILRHLNGGNYRLLGEAYVHGVMHGETTGMGLKFQDIVLE